MTQFIGRSRGIPSVDLSAIRDTLLYIESDLAGSAHYRRLADAVTAALNEVARLEAAQLHLPVAADVETRFLPAGL